MAKVVVAKLPIKAGERIQESSLCLRRASGGLPPAYLPLIAGREAKCDIEANTVISLSALR